MSPAWFAVLLTLAPLAPDSAAVDASAPPDTAAWGHTDTARVVPPPAPRRRPPLVPLKDLGHAVTTFGSDLWLVVSSPSRMDARDALWLAGAAGAAAVLYANDEVITQDFQRSRDNRVYDAVLRPGRRIEPVGNMGNTLVYYFSGMGIGYALRIQPLREVTSEFIESHFISGGIRNAAEFAIGRFRPFEKQGSRHFRPGEGTSFPSGHASSVVELATILSHHAHSLPVSIVLYSLAGSSLLERIDSKSHWPSDVFVGAVTGFVVSRTVVSRHEQRHRARIAPYADRRDGVTRLGFTTRF